MNLRRQIVSHVTLTKFFLAICLLMLTTAFKCSDDVLFPDPPPHPGGIRIETQEGLEGIAVGGVPIGNVPNSGFLNQILGPGTGFATDFAGPTNANGIRDWPLARTNATWTFSVTYTTVIPRCGSRSFIGIFVPDVGVWWVWICRI
jgi:hypothetical protein